MRNVAGERILAAGAVSRHVALPNGDGRQNTVTIFNLGQVSAFVALSNGGAYVVGIDPIAVASPDSTEVPPGKSASLQLTSHYPGRAITGQCHIAAIAPDGLTLLCVVVGH
jgi:hypothetical protein